MLSPVNCPIFTNFLNSILKNSSRILQPNLIKRRKNVRVSEMLLPFYLNWCWVFNLWINSCFRCIVNPLANKYLILFTEEVRSLSFSLVVDPVPLKMISHSFCQHSISTPFSHVPHTLINISIRIYHPSLSMRKIVHPHSIVSVTCLVEHRSSSLLRIIFPISCVLPSQLILSICNPVCALTMSFVLGPPSLILISIGIVLNTESFFLIILPVSYIFMRSWPFIRFLRSIFVKRLFLNVGIDTLTQ